MPRLLVHSKKRSKAWSGVSHGSGSLPSSGSHQVGESAPSEPNSASVPVPPENELAAPAPETVLAAVSVVVCTIWLLSLAVCLPTIMA